MSLDLWMIVATALSPLIAIQVSEVLRDRKERKERRFQVFRTLMATRAASLSPAHVEALNTVDVVFHGTDRASRSVVEAVRVYLEHMNRDASSAGWGERRIQLFVELLQKMAGSLGYDMDRVSIERTSYFPRGYGEAEWEAVLIRKAVLAVLNGERPIHVAPPVSPSPPQPPAVEGPKANPQS
jgi:hypothetical protein